MEKIISGDPHSCPLSIVFGSFPLGQVTCQVSSIGIMGSVCHVTHCKSGLGTGTEEVQTRHNSPRISNQLIAVPDHLHGDFGPLVLSLWT